MIHQNIKINILTFNPEEKEKQFSFSYEKKESNEQFNAYHVFRLRVQNSRVSEYPELLIAYHALSKVFKESVLELDDIDKDNYFLKKHIIKTEFKKVIPVNTNEFITFNPDNIFSTSPDSNKMIFGQEKTNISPKFGINSGVYKHPPNSQDIEFFYICHKDHEKKVKKFDDYFKGKKPISKYDRPITKDKNGNPIYAAISKYIGVTHKNYKEGHILFENENNPAPEVLNAIENNDYNLN